ncbi:hypothetical protein EKO04_002909 [Ascochyta lentis]|uniref:Uncharacterized protein n=1 Tax=Ascochyta lentis TaxID=205686 RepID=A0A8H7J938_9PLEO|nr:hypothetical protein EKO04_002909 [Ascochyta lentis]
MNLVTKATNSIATRAEGAFANCGEGGDGYELSYSCQGPACSSLDVNFQNVVCHKDGSSKLICSNNIKCQSGTSPYQSNFTFSQNEPDFWSPVMENEPDTWVHQDQHVLLGSCARFSLTSDGTREGTRVHDEGQTDVCPNVQELPMLEVGGGVVGVTSSTTQSHVGATNRPLAFVGTSSRHAISKSSLLFAFFFSFVLLLPGSQASAVHQHLEQHRQRTGTRTRAVFGRVRAFAEEFGTELARKVDSQEADGEIFAHNLVADVVSSVCQGHFNGKTPGAFAPEVIQGCVASVYGADRLLRPATQFLTVFGASLLCDYIASEAYPSGREFLPDGCDGLKDLTSKIPTKASTRALSTPIAPSSSGRQTASAGTLPTVGPLSDEQDSTQLVKAISQSRVPEMGSSNMVLPYTLPIRTTPSEMPLPSRLGAGISVANAPVVDTLPTSAFLPANSSPSVSSAHTVSVPSLISSPELLSSGLSLSELVSPGVPPTTSVPIGSSGPKMASSNSIVGAPSIGLSASPKGVIASQDNSPVVSSQSVQSASGLPNQATEQDADVSVKTAGSSTASPSRTLSGSFTPVSSSSTHPTPGVFAASQEPLLDSTVSPQPSNMPSPSISSLGTLPSGTYATNTPFSDTQSMDSPSLIPNASSTSLQNTAPSNVAPSNVRTPSSPMSSPSPLQLGAPIIPTIRIEAIYRNKCIDTYQLERGIIVGTKQDRFDPFHISCCSFNAKVFERHASL